jgi:hypothetical protein
MPVADFAQGVTTPFFSMVNHTNDGARVTIASASTDKSTDTGKPLLTAGADGKSFFENMLDVVNPLEHLPIVSTIYHAITGNQSGDVEKIAGDTLYGGPIGLLSSVADVAFEKITGKDFGDTMLAMVGLGSDDAKNGDTKLAANAAKTPDTDVAVTAALNRASLNKATLIPTPATKLAEAADTSSLVTSIPPIIGLDAAPEQTASAAPATAAATSVATAQAAQSIIDISPQTDALLAALQKNGVTGAMQSQAMDAYRRTMTMNSTPANGAPATLH